VDLEEVAEGGTVGLRLSVWHEGFLQQELGYAQGRLALNPSH
jgi:hypothetical protein